MSVDFAAVETDTVFDGDAEASTAGISAKPKKSEAATNMVEIFFMSSTQWRFVRTATAMSATEIHATTNTVPPTNFSNQALELCSNYRHSKVTSTQDRSASSRIFLSLRDLKTYKNQGLSFT